jgi:hypothetical protein
MLFDLLRMTFEEGPKGTLNSLRAYAMASSGDNFSSFAPEG